MTRVIVAVGFAVVFTVGSIAAAALGPLRTSATVTTDTGMVAKETLESGLTERLTMTTLQRPDSVTCGSELRAAPVRCRAEFPDHSTQFLTVSVINRSTTTITYDFVVDHVEVR